MANIRSRFRSSVMLAALAGMVCCSASADQPSSANTLDRLEQLVQQQKIRIADLQQLASQEQVGDEAARIAALKQQIREVLGEQEFRESLTPAMLLAGYDRGFFIKSSDERFLMRFNARMQFRWTHYATGSSNRYVAPRLQRNDRTGFDIPRLYLAFSGHAYTPDLTYTFILDGSEYRNYNFGVLHAWANYRFRDEFQFRAGVMRVSGTRANFDTATMQFVETPMLEEAYTLHRGLGVRFWGELFKGQPVHGEYRLDVINSLANPGTRTITTDDQTFAQGHDNNPAIIFRTIWALLGGECEHPGAETAFTSASCDAAWHTTPFLSAGFHYAYTEDDHDGTLSIPVAHRTPLIPGGFALVSSDGLQIHQWGVDGSFKLQGFSATAEYVLRLLDVRKASSRPFAPVFLATGEGGTSTQHMAYLQCGYFLPVPGFERKFEIVGRVGMMHINTGGSETSWEYSGGLNYYIEGHRWKIQADVTRITEAPYAFSANSLANVNDDALVFRVQMQLAF